MGVLDFGNPHLPLASLHVPIVCNIANQSHNVTCAVLDMNSSFPMYQAHNFNYPVNVRLLRKWLGTINTFFYIIKIMFRYDASTNEDPARMSIVVVSAVSQKRKVIIQSQLQPEPQKHTYCSNGQKPEPYRSEARTSQIASRLIQARRAGEKRRSQVFLSHIQFSCGQDEEPEAVPSRRARVFIQ